MKQLIIENPIISIMRNVALEVTTDYIQSVYEGGIKAFEIALNSQDALSQIKLARKTFSNNIRLGAGTVLTVELAKKAIDAGAEFLLSPSTNPDVLEYCAVNNIKILPGVMTPTDVSISLQYGFSVMKLFPASDLPTGYLKSLKGPFDQTEYIAVGGVSPTNIKSFFQQGYLGVGIGNSLVSSEHLSNHRWESITASIKNIVRSL